MGMQTIKRGVRAKVSRLTRKQAKDLSECIRLNDGPWSLDAQRDDQGP